MNILVWKYQLINYPYRIDIFTEESPLHRHIVHLIGNPSSTPFRPLQEVYRSAQKFRPWYGQNAAIFETSGGKCLYLLQNTSFIKIENCSMTLYATVFVAFRCPKVQIKQLFYWFEINLFILKVDIWTIIFLYPLSLSQTLYENSFSEKAWSTLAPSHNLTKPNCEKASHYTYVHVF